MCSRPQVHGVNNDAQGDVISCISHATPRSSPPVIMVTMTTTMINATTTSYEDLIEHDLIRYTLIALHVIGIIISVVGNGFLIGYVVLHARGRSRRPTNATAYLILNLATCDLVKTLIQEPMRLIDVVKPYGSFRDTMEFCKTAGFTVIFLGCVGFHTIVAISQERLLLICYPLTAKRWLTRATMWKVLVVIWVVAFCSALPFPVLFSYHVSLTLRSKTYRFCTINLFDPNLAQGRHYYFFIFTAYYALPVVIVAASYMRIFHSLNRSDHTGAYAGASGRRFKHEAIMRMLKHRKSLAKMMVAIAVCFAVFEGPLFFTFLHLSLGKRISKNAIFLKMIIEWLPMLSSIVNPVIYSTRVKTFRRSLASGGSGSTSTFYEGDGANRYGTEGVSRSSSWRRSNTGPRGVRLKPRPTPLMTQPLAMDNEVLEGTVVFNSMLENEDHMAEEEEDELLQGPCTSGCQGTDEVPLARL